MTHAPEIELTDEDRSKDEFFRRIAEIADEMIARHGREFAMGALVLAAQWIAENRPDRGPGGGRKSS